MKQKNKSQGVQGPPHYTTHPTGLIKTQGQSTKEALTAVMSQLKEKTGDKFLLEKGLGKGNPVATSPLEGVGAPDAHSPCLDEAVSRSLMGPVPSNLKDSVTKRRSQMGLLDTDSASGSSLTKFWNNVGDITSWSYVEQCGDDVGVIFLTPNNDKISHNQSLVIHKCMDALQEEFTQANLNLKCHLNYCETVNDDLCNKLTIGLQGLDTKYSELLIDDLFVKNLPKSVEIVEKNLGDFRDVYTSFWEKAFTPLLGNVDANNLCLNELRRDVTSVKDNVCSLTQ